MILVILLYFGGAMSVLTGVITILSPELGGPFSGPNFTASLPLFISGLALFGIGQVISALIRTAEATEAMYEEMTKMNAHQTRQG